MKQGRTSYLKPVALATALTVVALAPLVLGGCKGDREQTAAEDPWVEIAGHRWYVMVAVTDEQRRAGLSGFRSLGAGEGMLFVFPKAQVQEFWMKGCVIPIDVAFIDAQGRVVKMHTMPVPSGDRLPSYSSEAPVPYALEVVGGGLQKAGVKIGDSVTFSGGIRQLSKGAEAR